MFLSISKIDQRVKVINVLIDIKLQINVCMFGSAGVYPSEVLHRRIIAQLK